MLQYSQVIKKLFATNQTGGIKLGLENCLSLNAALSRPAHAYPTVHVAGTNGKGSVVTKIATALKATGLKVGIYTSPHIACFRERITINGEMISEEAVTTLMNELFEITETQKIPATFFELTTFLAFKYFADQAVDVAVIETGLGGRLDATNIVQPKLSVITSISLDHTDLLGYAIEDIAYEKAGIIKPNTPVIIGPTVPLSVIQPIAEKLLSPVYTISGEYATYDEENKALAAAALKLLEIPEEAIQEGINTLPSCRFEVFNRKHLEKIFRTQEMPAALIMDVAHNPAGFQKLLKQTKEKFPGKPLFFVCGLSKNKDTQECLRLLNENGKYFYLVEAANGRATPAGLLQKQLLIQGAKPETICVKSSVKNSVEAALDHAAKEEGIVIACGTFFIMAEVREALGMKESRDSLDLG